MTPASAAATAATTTTFAVCALASRFHPFTTTLVARAAVGHIARRNAALFPAIPGATTILEPAHAESGLTFIGTLGLVARRQRLALRPARRTIVTRPAVAASTATTPTTPLASFAPGPGHNALPRLARLCDWLVTKLFTRRTSSRGVHRALAPVAPSTGPLATRRATATGLTGSALATRTALAIAAAIPAAALTTTTSTIPATAATAALGTSSAITSHTAWLFGFFFAHRATRTRRHPHAEWSGPEAEKTRRSFLHHRDHCLGTRQAQRRQSLVHCLLERPAFEDVASGFGHAFLVWGAPGSCVSTGDRRAVSEP